MAPEQCWCGRIHSFHYPSRLYHSDWWDVVPGFVLCSSCRGHRLIRNLYQPCAICRQTCLAAIPIGELD